MDLAHALIGSHCLFGLIFVGFAHDDQRQIDLKLCK